MLVLVALIVLAVQKARSKLCHAVFQAVARLPPFVASFVFLQTQVGLLLHPIDFGYPRFFVAQVVSLLLLVF